MHQVFAVFVMYFKSRNLFSCEELILIVNESNLIIYESTRLNTRNEGSVGKRRIKIEYYSSSARLRSVYIEELYIIRTVHDRIELVPDLRISFSLETVSYIPVDHLGIDLISC